MKRYKRKKFIKKNLIENDFYKSATKDNSNEVNYVFTNKNQGRNKIQIEVNRYSGKEMSKRVPQNY